MNRRTLLRSVGALGALGLAGCLGDEDDGSESLFQNPFSGQGVRTPVPVEITSEADSHYNVQLEAYDPETGRKTYEEGYTVVPGEHVGAPHLDGIDQRFRVTRLGGDDGEDLVEEVPITTDSQRVSVRVFDDDLEVRVHEGDGEEPEDDLPEPTEADDGEDVDADDSTAANDSSD